MDRTDQLETARILARYRRLVLLAGARLPLDVARRLVGPDCAFHLYFRHAAGARKRRRHLPRRAPADAQPRKPR
jgi:hypothetical protein